MSNNPITGASSTWWAQTEINNTTFTPHLQRLGKPHPTTSFIHYVGTTHCENPTMSKSSKKRSSAIEVMQQPLDVSFHINLSYIYLFLGHKRRMATWLVFFLSNRKETWWSWMELPIQPLHLILCTSPLSSGNFGSYHTTNLSYSCTFT